MIRALARMPNIVTKHQCERIFSSLPECTFYNINVDMHHTYIQGGGVGGGGGRYDFHSATVTESGEMLYNELKVAYLGDLASISFVTIETRRPGFYLKSLKMGFSFLK